MCKCSYMLFWGCFFYTSAGSDSESVNFWVRRVQTASTNLLRQTQCSTPLMCVSSVCVPSWGPWRCRWINIIEGKQLCNIFSHFYSQNQETILDSNVVEETTTQEETTMRLFELQRSVQPFPLVCVSLWESYIHTNYFYSLVCQLSYHL